MTFMHFAMSQEMDRVGSYQFERISVEEEIPNSWDL